MRSYLILFSFFITNLLSAQTIRDATLIRLANGDTTFISQVSALRASITLDGEVNGATSATTVDTVRRIWFDRTYNQPDSLGKLQWDANEQTLQLGLGNTTLSTVLDVGQETLYPKVINNTSAIIKKGTPVMVDTVGVIQGDNIRVRPAIGSTARNVSTIMGVAVHDIGIGETGFVTWFGHVTEVNHTDIAQTGITLDTAQILYLSSTEPGKFTNVIPTAPNLKVPMAIVIRKPTANNMTLLVRPQLTPDIHDVNDVSISNPTAGQVLRYNSGGFWENGQVQAAGIANNSIDSTKIATGAISITDINQSNASPNQVLKWNGTQWAPAPDETASGSGATNLTFSENASPFKLNSDTGTDVTFAQGNGITLSRTNNELTVTAVDQSATNEGRIGVGSGASNSATILTNTPGSNAVSIEGAGIIFITKAPNTNGGTITLTGTEVDGSVSNEGSLSVGAGTATTSLIQSNTSGSTNVTLEAGPNIFLSETGNTINIDAADTDLELSGSASPYFINSSTGSDVSIAQGNGITLSRSINQLTITAADQSATNELQDLSLSGQTLSITSGTGVTLPVVGVAAGTGLTVSASSGTHTLALTGQALDLHNLSTNGILARVGTDNIEARSIQSGSGITVTNGDGVLGNISIAATDASVTNEGVLSVGAGTSGTSLIQSNTSGSNTVTLEAGSNITLTENTTTNTITIASSGGGGTPAGSNFNVQFNNAGVFGAESVFTYDTTNNRLGVGVSVPVAALNSRTTLTAATALSFLAENNKGDDVIKVKNNGEIQLGNNEAIYPLFKQSTSATDTSFTGNGITFESQPAAGTSDLFSFYHPSSSISQTTNIIRQGGILTVTSGSSSYRGYIGNPTINVSGGTGDVDIINISPTVTQAAGGINMIDINPSVTAASGGLRGLYTNITSASNFYQIFADGTAVSRFDGNVGILTDPDAAARLHVNGVARVDATILSRGTGSVTGSTTSAALRLQNTTPTTGKTWFLGSTDNGTFELSSTDASNVITTDANSTVKIGFKLAIGDTSNVSPNSILGRNTTSGEVGTIKIGSGLSLASGTLSATGGGSGTVTTSGSPITNRLAKFTGSTEIGNSLISESGQIATVNATGALIVPAGNNTTQLPSPASNGMVRYDTDNNALEYYNAGATAWEVPLKGSTATGLETAGRVLISNSDGRAASNSALKYLETNRQLVLSNTNYTPATTTKFAIVEDGSNFDAVMVAHGNTALTNPAFQFQRTRGSFAAPTANIADDRIGAFLFGAHDGTSILNSASFGAFVDGTPTTGSVPTRFVISVGTSGTNRPDRLTVKSTGSIGMGTGTPTANLEVFQPTTGPGTVTTTASGTTLTGTNTQFTNTFKVGDIITVSGETARTIASIASDVSLTVTSAFSATQRVNATYTLTARSVFAAKGNGLVGVGTANPENHLQVNGSFGRRIPVTVAAATYTVPDSITWIIVNHTASCTVTLPSAASWDGREIIIKTITSNPVISASSNIIPMGGGSAQTSILSSTKGAWATLVSNGTNWEIMQSGDDNTLSMILACSDETTDLTTGTSKVTFRAPKAMTITGVKANVNTASVGSTIIVDINEGGVSILGTKLSIDANEKTSVTAASAATITDTSIADDAEVTIDIDQVGSTTPGKGLKVTIYYR